MRSAAALAFLVIALGVVAAGCGDDSETLPAVEWADQFCTATRDWGDELERIGDEASDLSGISAEAIRDAGEDARAVTDDYVESIRELGRPDTESGQEIEDTLEALADEVDAESAEIEDALDDISGITGVVTAAREVASSAAAMFTALERALEAVDTADVDGELDAAFDEAESCEGFER